MTAKEIILPRLVGSASAAEQLVADAHLAGRRRVDVSARAVSAITRTFIFTVIDGLADAGVTEVTVSGASASLVEAFDDAAAGRMSVSAAGGAPSYEGILEALRKAVYDPFGEERSDFEVAEAVRTLLAQAGVTG